MARAWGSLIRRGLRKPPRYIAWRLLQEGRGQLERVLAPLRASKFSLPKLARKCGYATTSEMWSGLANRPSPFSNDLAFESLEALCPGERARILKDADMALQHRVDLLGSGPVFLGEKIDWAKDYKTSFRWPNAYCRDIEYNHLDNPCDVKFPWELSRMQWMIPMGQAYILTGDEQYAVATRNILEQWIQENPYARSVNWSCTMDVALRLVTWIWFFYAFSKSASWQDSTFRERFLSMLYLHGDFTARNLEKSDINGNHYTADAAGLVFAGLFFSESRNAAGWFEQGWGILNEEFPKQVFDDGVDFEGSIPYHRLVMELFLLPAMYAKHSGHQIPNAYRQRLIAMAHFIEAYSRPDGSVPLWGDADDARVLPLGGQELNDHRYLIGLTGIEFQVDELINHFSGPRSEIIWLKGFEKAKALPDQTVLDRKSSSVSFTDGGYYVMRNQSDHIFIDCGPVGMAGRGGHGHNDLLSFEAMLDGELLITDCGAYLYTADHRERNRFRSTAYHNTPQIDDEEINRFISWEELWTLKNDALPTLHAWENDRGLGYFEASHGGYQRLADPVSVKRCIALDENAHALVIVDNLVARNRHHASIPLHLAPHVQVSKVESNSIRLESKGKIFNCCWSEADWVLAIEEARVSPSYGRTIPSVRLRWTREWTGVTEFRLMIHPESKDRDQIEAHVNLLLTDTR